jgi:AhpD family alkylhydroperoxidase
MVTGVPQGVNTVCAILPHKAYNAPASARPTENFMRKTKQKKTPRLLPEVLAVFEDIKRTRNVPDVNNFWKYLARDPALLARTWQDVKQVMAPGALDPLLKEMIYVAVSVSNGCAYCIASHTAAARKAGMTEAMFGELMAVVGMANATNRLANGYRVPIDAMFES